MWIFYHTADTSEECCVEPELRARVAGVQKERILYRGQESHLGLCSGEVCRGCERRMVGHKGREFEGVGESMGGGLMTQRKPPPLSMR